MDLKLKLLKRIEAASPENIRVGRGEHPYYHFKIASPEGIPNAPDDVVFYKEIAVYRGVPLVDLSAEDVTELYNTIEKKYSEEEIRFKKEVIDSI